MEAAKKKYQGQTENVQLPDNVKASYENSVLTLKGPNGENKKSFATGEISIKTAEGSIIIAYGKGGKRSKKSVQTIKAHIRNMIKGVQEGHTYKLKMCAGHFPMSATISGNELVVKNFIGEKHPRRLGISPEVKASVDGQEIILKSANKEAAAQCAAAIEHLTKRAGFDRRIFMDGIFITNKDGKEVK